MNIPRSQVNSRQVERPNKAYQIAEPDNRAARVEWLSDTVEKEDTTDRLVNSMAWLARGDYGAIALRTRTDCCETKLGHLPRSCLEEKCGDTSSLRSCWPPSDLASAFCIASLSTPRTRQRLPTTSAAASTARVSRSRAGQLICTSPPAAARG